VIGLLLPVFGLDLLGLAGAVARARHAGDADTLGAPPPGALKRRLRGRAIAVDECRLPKLPAAAGSDAG